MHAGPSGEPWDPTLSSRQARREPSPPRAGAEHDRDAQDRHSHRQPSMYDMPWAEHIADSPGPSNGLHVTSPLLAVGNDAAEGFSEDVDPLVMPLGPALGEALPADPLPPEEDEFLEELHPFEAAAYGDISGRSGGEEEELIREGNDGSVAISYKCITLHRSYGPAFDGPSQNGQTP